MARKLDDWLTSYVDYASYGEAPSMMSFWCGVSAIAGALRRKVWIDMSYFRWHPNFYVIIVAPPGVVGKSTTAGIAMNILRKVPGINFGPDVVTWQALVKSFSESLESFKFGDDWMPMSALTIESSEFGNLFNPQDRDMVDLLVTLWDGKPGAFTKITKMSGNDSVENPWINIIACTTPAWIAGNFPDYLIGGGFTSRCIFVYAEEKARYVAYPFLHVPRNHEAIAQALIHDLEHIATTLVGPYTLNASALAWGDKWYENHYSNRPSHLDDERFGGYIARKQTHIHKLAMCLAASTKDEMIITENELALANTMVTSLELDMPKVFAKIGKTEESIHADRLIEFVKRNGKAGVLYMDAYQHVHANFPNLSDFEGVLSGAIRAGYIMSPEQRDNVLWLVPGRN